MPQEVLDSGHIYIDVAVTKTAAPDSRKFIRDLPSALLRPIQWSKLT